MSQRMSKNNQILWTCGVLLNLKFLVGNDVFLAKNTISRIYRERNTPRIVLPIVGAVSCLLLNDAGTDKQQNSLNRKKYVHIV
jgi:hypothetical protein